MRNNKFLEEEGFYFCLICERLDKIKRQGSMKVVCDDPKCRKTYNRVYNYLRKKKKV